MINISEKISSLRKAHNLTQEALGEAVGVSAQAVSKWEKGDSSPDISVIPDICRTFGISADTLLGNEGNMTAEMYIEKAVELSGQGAREIINLMNKLIIGDIDHKNIQFCNWFVDCFSVADSRGFVSYFSDIEYVKNMMAVDLTKSDMLKFMSDEKALKIFSLICLNGRLNESEIIKLTGFSQQDIAERIFAFMKCSVVCTNAEDSEIAYAVGDKGVLLLGVMANIFLLDPVGWKGIESSGSGTNVDDDKLRKFME